MQTNRHARRKRGLVLMALAAGLILMVAAGYAVQGAGWPVLQREITVRFDGLIEAQEGDVWRVGGHLVAVSPAVLAKLGSPTPHIGAYVMVRAVRGEEGLLLARSISLLDAPAGGFTGLPALTPVAPTPLPGAEMAVEFEDEIVRLPDGENWLGRWTVGDVYVIVDPQTKMTGTPRLGANAEVSAILEGERLARALAITVKDAQEEGDIWQGQIIALDAGGNSTGWGFRLQESEGGRTAQRVKVIPQTFLDESGGRLGLRTWVEVRGVRLADGVIQAAYIRVRRQ